MTVFPSTIVEQAIKQAIRRKLETYSPEPSDKPFHVRLLGRDRMALFTFIHSLNTTFGTSIYEPVAKEIAKSRFDEVELQAKAPNQMTTNMRSMVDEIVRKLEAADSEPNWQSHERDLRSVLDTNSKPVKVRLSKIDILLQKDNRLYLVDIKTAKPNVDGFQKYKRKLLEWKGAFLEDNHSLDIHPMIAIPYNPYEPQPYQRWTIRGMIDIHAELKVAEEFWDFLGGQGAYQQILDCFERVGLEMRDEINSYFAQYSGHT